MAVILKGRELADRIRLKIKNRIEAAGVSPGLAVILVGNDPASHTYVGLKQKACEEAGIRFEKFLYFATESEETLINKIKELNDRNDIQGILVQLPLPSQDPNPIIDAIDPKKDVDGFHRENVQNLKKGLPGLVPAVALGIMKLVDEPKLDLNGKHAIIVGSELFAEPLVSLVEERGMTPDVVSASDPELQEKTKTADVLIVAVGRPGLITGGMVKTGSIVIDVGTTRVDEKLVGDVDRVSVDSVAGYITPVPGGVGPMTVAMLLVNVLKAYNLQKI